MKCPDCKGRGEYIGARIVEPCAKCKGRGELNPDGTLLKLPKWMDKYKDQIEFNPKVSSGWSDGKKDLTAEELEQLLKDAFTKNLPSPELKIGDIIHIYDTGWYEAEITTIEKNADDPIMEVRYAHGYFALARSRLGYNDTQKRWEYIRVGTPVWP